MTYGNGNALNSHILCTEEETYENPVEECRFHTINLLNRFQ